MASPRRQSVAVLTLLALLLAAAGAAASPTAGTPAPGALLGGGTLGPRYAERPDGHPDVRYVTLRVGADGKSVKLFGDWPSACKGRGHVIANFVGTGTLAPGGTFSGRGKRRKQAFARNLRFSFQGAFESPSSAHGHGRVTFTFVDGKRRYTCDSGRVPFEVRTSRKPTGNPTPRKGRAYYGNTRTSFPFMLRVAPNGKRVAQAATELNLRCTTIKQGVFYAVTAPAAKIVRGRFSRKETFDDRYLFGQGRIGHVSSTVSGSFGSSGVSGTWRIAVIVRNAVSGEKVGTCRSGVVRWTASV